jgi:L-cystine transport system permease protein
MGKYELDWSLAKESLLGGLMYVPRTVEIAVVGLAIAIIFGLLMALARFYKVPVISQVLRVYLTIFKGLPFMLVLLVVNILYVGNIMKIIEFFHLNTTPADIDTLFLGVLLMGIALAPAASEAFMGALLSIEKIQFESGLAVGLTTRQLLVHIILPQVIPTSMPMIMNLLVASFKASAMVYTIGITEVMYACLLPSGRTYRYLEGYIAAALIFWALSIVMNFVGNKISYWVRIEKIKKEKGGAAYAGN